MPTVLVVLLAEGWPLRCHIMCTARAGVTAGVLVAVGTAVNVAVGVLVGGHGSASDEVPLALIIQLPLIAPADNASIVPRVALAPRLEIFGTLPLLNAHDRTCDGGESSMAAGYWPGA